MTVPHIDDTRWRTATFSENTACVELHPDGLVRDSKNPAGPVIAAGFAGLVKAVQAGTLTR